MLLRPMMCSSVDMGLAETLDAGRTLRISGEGWIYIGIGLDRVCPSGWTSSLQHWSKLLPAQHLRYLVPKDKSTLQQLPANVLSAPGPNWPQWESGPAPRSFAVGFHLASLFVQIVKGPHNKWHIIYCSTIQDPGRAPKATSRYSRCLS